jgi:hypothetical protein
MIWDRAAIVDRGEDGTRGDRRSEASTWNESEHSRTELLIALRFAVDSPSDALTLIWEQPEPPDDRTHGPRHQDRECYSMG